MDATGHISGVDKHVKIKTRAGRWKAYSQRGKWNLHRGIYKKGVQGRKQREIEGKLQMEK
jgi:hypothetical protein